MIGKSFGKSTLVKKISFFDRIMIAEICMKAEFFLYQNIVVMNQRRMTRTNDPKEKIKHSILFAPLNGFTFDN